MSWWRQELRADLVIGFVVGIASARFLQLDGDASTLYQVTGGSGAALIAFVITPVATLLTLRGGARYDTFDRIHRHNIIRAMCWGFGLSVVLIAVSVAGGAVDTSEQPAAVLRGLVIASVTAAALASVRLFWFFVAALSVRYADDDDPILNDRAPR